MSEVRRMPVRTATVEFDGDYAGWEATIRTNIPVRILEDMRSGETDRIETAVAEIVKSWNFVDEQGEPLGIKPESIGELPIDLLTALIEGVRDKTQTPKPTSGSSPVG